MTGAVTTTWWRAPPAGIRASRGRADLAEFGPAGQHDVFGVDRAVGGVDADHAAARGAQAGERAAFADVDPVRGERGGVGQHVARRVDVAVAGRIGRAERRAWRQTGVRGRRCRADEPLDVEAELLLQRDALVRLRHLGFA